MVTEHPDLEKLHVALDLMRQAGAQLGAIPVDELLVDDGEAQRDRAVLEIMRTCLMWEYLIGMNAR